MATRRQGTSGARSVESERGSDYSVQVPDLEDRRPEISVSLSRERSRRRSNSAGIELKTTLKIIADNNRPMT